jgi:hypothetical protein
MARALGLIKSFLHFCFAFFASDIQAFVAAMDDYASARSHRRRGTLAFGFFTLFLL